ncbi:MAG: hypothetical protein JXQ23_11875 [Clostridia bacterium]|nr:hypothetical protein [Clostridia bacterium]
MSTEQSSLWYRLDTSANIYPGIESSRDTAIFRVSLTLKEDVIPSILLQAMENCRKRFPYYNVHLKKGLFWNYLQENHNSFILWPDTPYPCERMYPFLNNGYLYKIKYFNKRIALEVFHVLTDGYGAMEFLKTVLQEYLILSGKLSSPLHGILHKEEIPPEEEYEDAFLKVLENQKEMTIEKKRSLFGNKGIYQLHDKLEPHGVYHVVTGVVSVDQLRKAAREHDATITELLAALYMEALIHIQAEQVKVQKNHKEIAIQIPVNMRKYYPYKCMRNFSLFVIPFIDPRKVFNLEDIIVQIKSFLKSHLTSKHLLTMIQDNCSLATNKVVRHIPVDFKNMFISFINNTLGSSQFSGTLTNLGQLSMPDEMAAFIEDATIIAGPSPHGKTTCGIVSYLDHLNITFGRSINDTKVEEYVFTKLVKMGVHVKIKSNT